MKAAILIYGMYREFDYCITKWIDIEKYYECDYYFSTWKQSKQKYENSDSFKEFSVTPDMITNYLPNCTYDIVDENLVFPIKPIQPSSNQLLFHWKNVYDMMIKSNKEYDIVILIRSDSILHFKDVYGLNFEKWIKTKHTDLFGSDIRVVSARPYTYMIEDLMFIGSVDVIGSIINKIPDVTNIKEILHSHFWLAKTLLSMNIIPNQNFPFSSAFVRPNL